MHEKTAGQPAFFINTYRLPSDVHWAFAGRAAANMLLFDQSALLTPLISCRNVRQSY